MSCTFCETNYERKTQKLVNVLKHEYHRQFQGPMKDCLRFGWGLFEKCHGTGLGDVQEIKECDYGNTPGWWSKENRKYNMNVKNVPENSLNKKTNEASMKETMSENAILLLL